MANTVIGSTGPAIYGLSRFKSQTQSDTTKSDHAAQDATKDLSKDMFLTLMVAQLKNQNPLNPIDGTDFLQQLSQISGVEQMVEMRKELEAIHQLLGTAAGSADQS